MIVTLLNETERMREVENEGGLYNNGGEPLEFTFRHSVRFFFQETQVMRK